LESRIDLLSFQLSKQLTCCFYWVKFCRSPPDFTPFPHTPPTLLLTIYQSQKQSRYPESSASPETTSCSLTRVCSVIIFRLWSRPKRVKSAGSNRQPQIEDDFAGRIRPSDEGASRRKEGFGKAGFNITT